MILALCLALSVQEPAAPAASATPWDALAKEYEQAFEQWASQMQRSGGYEKPEGERPPSPRKPFCPRFEELSAAGDGRATVWLLQSLEEFPDDRAARAGKLFERVRAAGDAAWVARALPELAAGENHVAGLGDYVAGLGRTATDPALRTALLRARAALASDKTQAQELELRAAFLKWKGVELGEDERVEGELVGELERPLVDGVKNSNWFEENFYEGTDGVYYAHTLCDPDPKETWGPALSALAARGSTAARVWVLTNSWPGDEAKKAEFRAHLEALAHAEVGAEDRKQMLWYVDSWMQSLGADFVEPRVRAIAAQGGEEEQAQLLSGLGVGRCEAAADDAEREKGLALLREVLERFPKTNAGKGVEGQLFRFTNLVVGKTVPDFDAVDVDGNEFRLSDYKGKVTVVDFWGFW